MPTPVEMKKALIAAGVEVYRTRGDVIHISERVRENLIMDSGVRVDTKRSVVMFSVRAQRADFPKDSEPALYDKARNQAHEATSRGYAEIDTQLTEMKDPSDSGKVLDTWFEVLFEKEADGIDGLIDEVKFALTVEKAAGQSSG